MRNLWTAFNQNRLALAGLIVVGLYALAALAAPLLAPYDPLEMSAAAQWQAPGVEHFFGTDMVGRDIFSRVLYGARISLWIAALAVGFALGAGTLLGLAASYFGGWVDASIGRVTDVMFSLPEIVLALVIVAVLGPGFMNIALAIGIVYTPIFARVSRGAALHVRGQPYVEAARSLGYGDARIMMRHILPNILPALIVQTTLSLAFAMLTEAAISFLGLSGETDAPSWGLMLRRGKDEMLDAWWTAVFPGLAITLAVLSFNVVGDGLQEVLDPKMRGSRT